MKSDNVAALAVSVIDSGRIVHLSAKTLDYSKLIVAYLNSDNAFILDKTTTSTITPIPLVSQQGYYTWFLTAINNHLYYTHSDGDTGVRTISNMDVVGKRAIIIFANSEYDNTNLYKSIEIEM